MGLSFMDEVLHKETGHLVEPREQVLDSVERKEVLLALFLIQVSTKKVSHTGLHDSLFDLGEVVGIKFKIFYQLRRLFAIDIGAEGVDQFLLQLVIVLDQQLGSLQLVHVYQPQHQLLKVEVLLELVPNDH